LNWQRNVGRGQKTKKKTATGNSKKPGLGKSFGEGIKLKEGGMSSSPLSDVRVPGKSQMVLNQNLGIITIVKKKDMQSHLIQEEKKRSFRKIAPNEGGRNFFKLRGITITAL